MGDEGGELELDIGVCVEWRGAGGGGEWVEEEAAGAAEGAGATGGGRGEEWLWGVVCCVDEAGEGGDWGGGGVW